jgi:phage recombination protein Bet
MTTTTALATAAPRVSLVSKIAQKYAVDPAKLLDTLKATAFKQKDNAPPVTNEQMMALLIVSDQYGLNPFTREIYAFPDKQNGIVPVVGVDGWARIINEHPQLDGMAFVESEALVFNDEHKPCPEWIDCVIYRKDRTHPITVRERFFECYRAPFKGKDGYVKPGPWQSHTSRFLRHKAMIQCSRIAFGFAGIFDPDEAERVRDMGAADEVLPAKAAPLARVQAAIRRPEPQPVVEQSPREALDEVARIDAELAQPVDQFVAEMNAAEEGAK